MSVNSVNADGSLTKIAGSGSTDTSVLKGDFSVVESTSTATRAYSIGDCFIMETGQLVRATSAIAINDTIAIGTNVAATSVVQLLSAKIDTSQKGANNGIAELDSSGKVPTTQLPSYVDDVVNGYLHEGTFYYDDQYTEPITPEDDKIYVDKTENKTYRWGGESYVEVGGGGVALGETSTTAYRGDRGKAAYDHSQDSGKLTTATASGFYKVASTSEGHIAGLTAVQKSDITALGIPGSDTTYGVVSKTDNGLCPVLPNETTTTKYLRQDGSWQVPPDTNTTYTVATGDANGQIKVTPSSGSAYNVGVKGLGTAAYENKATGVVEVGKTSSRSTQTVGTWTAMCNSTQTGSPVLPVSGRWWNVLHLNNWSDASTNWVSELVVPTQDSNSTLQDTVWFRHNDAAGTNIDSSTWHSLVSGAYVASARFGTTSTTTKIKINITATTNWMLSFVVTLYQGYRATKVMVSGYNYGSNHWYSPAAVMLGDSSNSTLNVYFGYDGTNALWVGFDGGNYTGVAITDVCNGHSQIPDYNGLFTISNVSSLATLQATVVVSGVSISLVT